MKNSPVPRNPINLSIFCQLCNLIPTHLVAKLARDIGAVEKSRSFTLLTVAKSRADYPQRMRRVVALVEEDAPRG